MTRRQMPVAYIAGPYRGANREAVELNIQAARAVGLLAARRGWAPIIPHANTGHLDGAYPSLGDDFWLDATMTLLRRSDALVLCPGWGGSVGTLDEIEEAKRLGIEIFTTVDQLPTGIEWLELELLQSDPADQ